MNASCMLYETYYFSFSVCWDSHCLLWFLVLIKIAAWTLYMCGLSNILWQADIFLEREIEINPKLPSQSTGAFSYILLYITFNAGAVLSAF